MTDSQGWQGYFKPPPTERGNFINSVYPGEDVDDAEDEIAPDYKIPGGDIADIDWFAKNHQSNSFSVPFQPDNNVSDNNHIPDIQLNYPYLSYSTHNPLPSSNLNSDYTLPTAIQKANPASDQPLISNLNSLYGHPAQAQTTNTVSHHLPFSSYSQSTDTSPSYNSQTYTPSQISPPHSHPSPCTLSWSPDSQNFSLYVPRVPKTGETAFLKLKPGRIPTLETPNEVYLEQPRYI